MAGCGSRDDKVAPALCSHGVHRGTQHEIFRSCTSDSVAYRTLGCREKSLGLRQGLESLELCGRASLLLERERLTALVLECLEAVHLSVWMLCRDRRSELTETTAGGPLRETYN